MSPALTPEQAARRRRINTWVFAVFGTLFSLIILIVVVGEIVNPSDGDDSVGSPAATPATITTATAESTTVDVDWPGRVRRWERQNAIATSDWWDLVTGIEVQSSLGLLNVETSIYPDGDAEAAAAPICGAYSTIFLDYPALTTVRVLASDGQRIAICGPDA
ncbi:hypothetical protein [Nocardioides bruguierae]|uniref:Uncharacterized protein n=1 Tax=Nocardioides bruguierae TaxID=2945102 RepID=A0A9X2IE20_9ACTN|nr:hypothetical protein [Nocardioides bruguierae]MCM0619822.1 hypothetical protein [Nocardioides bruguierae]